MSETAPTENDYSSVAGAAEFARNRVEEIVEDAAEDAVEADEVDLSLEEAVGQARPDVEGTPADEPTAE